jgi:hypothetical protein
MTPLLFASECQLSRDHRVDRNSTWPSLFAPARRSYSHPLAAELPSVGWATEPPEIEQGP